MNKRLCHADRRVTRSYSVTKRTLALRSFWSKGRSGFSLHVRSSSDTLVKLLEITSCHTKRNVRRVCSATQYNFSHSGVLINEALPLVAPIIHVLKLPLRTPPPIVQRGRPNVCIALQQDRLLSSRLFCVWIRKVVPPKIVCSLLQGHFCRASKKIMAVMSFLVTLLWRRPPPMVKRNSQC